MTALDVTSGRTDVGAAHRRRVWVRLFGLGLLLLAIRIPLLGHPTPVDVDETAFIGGLGFPAEYPVHHPGYPLWVGMGTVLHTAGLESYTAYQLWSLAASVAGPMLLYRGLRWVVDDGPAWWLALAFGVNPLVWFQGTTALSYMAGGTVGLLVVGLCYRGLVTGRGAALYWAAGVLGVGVSLRADLLIYLGPMVAYAAWRFRWRRGATAMGVLAAGVCVFLAMTSYLYGRGDVAAVRPDIGHTVDVVLGTSVFKLGFVDGLLRNLVKMVLNVGWDYGAGVLLLPPAVWAVVRRGCGENVELGKVLLLWSVPISVFLATMHVVQGYFLLLLPAGYCVIGIALQGWFKGRSAVRVAAIVAMLSFAQFVCYPWSPELPGPDAGAAVRFKRLLDAKIAFQSASGLRQIDRRGEIHYQGDTWPTKAHGE